MSGIIIYKGKYGATNQYATWLGEELNLPIAVSDEVAKEEFRYCDFIVIGTPVYLGKFLLSNWMKRNIALLAGKKIFLFIVNATSPFDIKARDKLIQQNLPQKIQINCQWYFLPGRIIHERLSLKDRIILKIAGQFERDALKKRALFEDINGVKKEEVLPVINAIKEYLTERAA